MLRDILIACALVAILLGFYGCGSESEPALIFQDDFEQGHLDQSRWEVTMDGDFAQAVVDVFDVDTGGSTDYELRLRANTIGTSDQLKFLGVRSRSRVDFVDGISLTFDLDWNDQANGCYLTASLYLCPAVSDNPKVENDWLKFEYAGVPPGQDVRINVWEKVDGLVHRLQLCRGFQDDQGVPSSMPLGLSSHSIGIYLHTDSLQVTHDGDEICRLSAHSLKFTKAHIYLQMCSGTNYPSREVYFDNVMVRGSSTNN